MSKVSLVIKANPPGHWKVFDMLPRYFKRRLNSHGNVDCSFCSKQVKVGQRSFSRQSYSGFKIYHVECAIQAGYPLR